MDPSRHSKWYQVKTKRELEIGLSLVRMTAWVCRFIDNCRKSAEQRQKGELKPLELQNVEEFNIREVQSKVYSEETEPLRRNKEILRGSTLAPFNPVFVNGILRSNTRLRYADVGCSVQSYCLRGITSQDCTGEMWSMFVNR